MWKQLLKWYTTHPHFMLSFLIFVNTSGIIQPYQNLETSIEHGSNTREVCFLIKISHCFPSRCDKYIPLPYTIIFHISCNWVSNNSNAQVVGNLLAVVAITRKMHKRLHIDFHIRLQMSWQNVYQCLKCGSIIIIIIIKYKLIHSFDRDNLPHCLSYGQFLSKRQTVLI